MISQSVSQSMCQCVCQSVIVLVVQLDNQISQPIGKRTGHHLLTNTFHLTLKMTGFCSDYLKVSYQQQFFSELPTPGRSHNANWSKFLTRIFFLSMQLMLLATWICIVSYSKGMIGGDGRVSFFKGITVFCWVMVILFQIAFAPLFSSLSQNFFSKPRHFTIIVSMLCMSQ